MPETAREINTKSRSVYDEMRAINQIDLTRNELKVWMVYRTEMDEGSRQVRGKPQDDLRALSGLGETQFRIASGSLQRRGLITCQRHRNAPQTITVNDPELHQEQRETRMSGYSEVPNSGPVGFPNSGPSGNPNDDIYTAPVSTPVSAPPRERAKAEATPSNVIPITNWSQAFIDPATLQGITVSESGSVKLGGEAQKFWLAEFGGDAQRLKAAVLAVRIQRKSQDPIAAQVGRQLAHNLATKLDREANYKTAIAAKEASKPKKTPAYLSRY